MPAQNMPLTSSAGVVIGQRVGFLFGGRRWWLRIRQATEGNGAYSKC